MKTTISPERLERLVSSPMAMRPEALRTLVADLMILEDFDEPPELEASFVEQIPTADEAKVPRLAKVKGAVGLIPVFGGIGQHRGGDYWASVYSEEIVAKTAGVLDNPNVGAAVLVFDTPGGIVYGVQEAATAIREMSQSKPVYGFVKGMAASAGYWLASATTKIFSNSSAESGSIGVWTMHLDASEALKKFGIDITMISAGKFKVEGNPFEPLNEEARAELQRSVDSYYEDFLDGVAIGRNVSKATVKNDFGEGRMLEASRAKAAGMIDGIATLDELLAGIMTPPDTRRRSMSAAISLAEAWSPELDA
ncbi:S49 family peptidase [Petrachloros mirabilis]